MQTNTARTSWEFMPVFQAIKQAERTDAKGSIGDGKIFILDLHEAIRIGSGETGTIAIG